MPLKWSHLRKKLKAGDCSLNEFFKDSLGWGTASVGIFKVETHRHGTAAIKLANEKHKDYLEREAEILSNLMHPNIRACLEKPRVFGKYACLRLEYTEGCDLFVLLSERTPPIVRKRQLVLQPDDPLLMCRIHILRCVLKAIEYLHANDIVHNDIKLENVIVGCLSFETLTTDTPVKLIDFNLACHLKDMNVLGRGGSTMWCAPEKFSSIWAELTTAVDIFSFGILIFATLTLGMPPGLQFREWSTSIESEQRLILNLQRIIVDSNKNALGLTDVKTALLGCLKFNALERKTASQLLKLSLFSYLEFIRTHVQTHIGARGVRRGMRLNFGVRLGVRLSFRRATRRALDFWRANWRARA